MCQDNGFLSNQSIPVVSVKQLTNPTAINTTDKECVELTYDVTWEIVGNFNSYLPVLTKLSICIYSYYDETRKMVKKRKFNDENWQITTFAKRFDKQNV